MKIKHNGQFDYRTGEAVRAPACERLNTFAVRINGDDILVEIDE